MRSIEAIDFWPRVVIMRFCLAIAIALVLLPGCAVNEAPTADDRLVEIFKPADRKTSGAYFWDDLREEVPEWKDLEYEWIASSSFGDQIIVTKNSPLHTGTAVYMHGPDVAGPESANPAWIENILYLGSSEEVWKARVAKYGDEHSVTPGSIDESLQNPDEYRAIYRKLNPGLKW